MLAYVALGDINGRRRLPYPHRDLDAGNMYMRRLGPVRLHRPPRFRHALRNFVARWLRCAGCGWAAVAGSVIAVAQRVVVARELVGSPYRPTRLSSSRSRGSAVCQAESDLEVLGLLRNPAGASSLAPVIGLAALSPTPDLPAGKR